MDKKSKECRNKLFLKLPVLLAFSFSGAASAQMCQQEQCTLIGTSGVDQLVGTSGDDVICGLEGNDLLVGLGGNDLICAGPGDDIIFGGEGSNIVQGGPGDDSIYSSSATDTVIDNEGDNFIRTWSSESTVLDQSYRAGRGFSLNQNIATTASQIDRTPEYDYSIARFTTKDHVIYAPDGMPFDVRGVSIFPWNVDARDLDGISQCWGFNTVGSIAVQCQPI